MKKAVLFDIDGTILDAWDFVFEAVKYSVNLHGLPYPSDEAVRGAMGRPLIEFYEMLFKGADIEKLAKAHRDFQEKNFALLKPFPKTKKILNDLKGKGFLIAAVSNRSRESLLYSLRLTGILDYFDVVIGADDVKNPKPHAEHPLAALGVLQVKPENAYMVGDTGHDILAGKNAKVKTIGAMYGWAGKDIVKYKPDYLINSIEELLKILN